MNINKDIKETVFEIEAFQKSVLKKYRTPITLLVGRYYANHPFDGVIKKIIPVVDGCDRKKYDTIEKQVNYIRGEI